MTSQQYYGGVNRRFDRRASLLRRLGFKYRQICPGVAVFTRTRYVKEQNIPAAFLSAADNRMWYDHLRTCLT